MIGLKLGLGLYRVSQRPVAPIVTSSASPQVAESAVLAHTLTADQTVTWLVVGGADQAQVEISGSTLRWSSNGTRNFEIPADSGGNNVYDVTVRATATASGLTADQNVAVTVTDIPDSFSASSSGIKTSTGPSANTFTFTPFLIGTAHAKRVAVATIAWSHSLGSTISAVTFKPAGFSDVPGIVVQAVTAHSVHGRIAMYYAEVPDGTSVDVKVDWSASIASGIACGVKYGYPNVSTPLDSGPATATGGGVVTVSNLQTEVGGALIVIAGGSNTSDTWTFGWTGPDTLNDDGHGTTNLTGWSMRHTMTTTATTTDDLTSDPSGVSATALIGATWGAP